MGRQWVRASGWALVAMAVLFGTSCRNGSPPVDPNSVEVTDYNAPASDPNDGLVDDTLDTKTPKFDPTFVDRRPFDVWDINLSDSVLRLDVPLVRADVEPALLELSPSYAAAVAAAKRSFGESILPSVNMIDGKAKQFDDGLYSAIDQAYYKGLDKALLSHVELIKRLYEKIGPSSVAAPYLAAGLELAGVKVEPGSPDEKARRLREFLADPLQAKPISFYEWTPTLSDCFRFLRYFQAPFGPSDAATAEALSNALREDPSLLADYRRAIAFYAKLTNPPKTRSLAGPDSTTDSRASDAVSVFPSSTSREAELFDRLFPRGTFPEGTDLMQALLKAIRSGKVDLKPRPDSGWYEHQVYALETLLLPERGAEHDRLLLTKSYKKRMLDAFKALITKRRETHARLFAPDAITAEAVPDIIVAPRLRVEPCPTYYLRTARSYAFLAHFLEATLGEPALKALHGLREGREQVQSLGEELTYQRDLFYGLYLLSAEDIGMKPELADDEGVNRAHCERLAEAWLPDILTDSDLARDTRVSVPIMYDPVRNVTKLWMTMGIRLTRLNASYARPPRVKRGKGTVEWTVVKPDQLRTGYYLIAVDEFAEVELKGPRVFTRKELRAICDQHKTKEAILEALRH